MEFESSPDSCSIHVATISKFFYTYCATYSVTDYEEGSNFIRILRSRPFTGILPSLDMTSLQASPLMYSLTLRSRIARTQEDFQLFLHGLLFLLSKVSDHLVGI
jgi:hypothetical protein